MRFQKTTNWLSTDLLSLRELIALSVVFPVSVLIMNGVMNILNLTFFNGTAAIPKTWPISVFAVHLGWQGTCISMGFGNLACPPFLLYISTIILTLVIFLGATHYIIYNHGGIYSVTFSGTILILLTNFLQGYQSGYVNPISGGSIQYYHDAIDVANPILFISNFEGLQPDLLIHSQTHPPGAVMLFYLLEQIIIKPGLISIVIAVASTIISSLYLYKIFNLRFSKRISNYLTYLFLLIPSIQIYYLSSLDAIITALSIGGLYYFIQEKNRGLRVISTVLFLGLCSFLTFGAVLFFVPLFFSYEIVKRRSISDSSAILLIIGIGYMILNVALDYNYINSFIIASSVENPNGFRLFADTTSYIFTRIEGFVEIFVFFTPYLVYLSYKYFNSTSHEDIVDSSFTLLSVLSGIILLGMFGAGVFRTGETARAAIFIYPLLFLPLGTYLYDQKPSHQSKVVLAIFVFIQSIMMQIVGFYFW